MTKKILNINPKEIKPPSVARVLPYTKSPDLAPPNPPLDEFGPGTRTMHEDLFASDASVWAGPYGRNSEITYFQNTTSKFAGICPSFVIDQEERLITISFSRGSTTLLRLHPHTMKPLYALALPPRSVRFWDALTNIDAIFASTSGGSYFVMDAHDRVIIPTTKNEIWIVSQHPENASRYFKADFKLKTDLPPNDLMTSALPVVASGRGSATKPASLGYWFVSEGGRIGVARPEGQTPVKTIKLPNNEEIGNSCVVNRNGLFVVSSGALYRFELSNGKIMTRFRAPYERGETKLGQLSPGSGTTPTLLGERYVAIGDNAKVMHVNLYCQTTGKLLDRRPVFADQKGSACENSFIGNGNSLIVSNTYGYLNPFKMHLLEKTPGLVRLDVDPKTHKMKEVWYAKNVDVMSSTSKLSLENGLIYFYSMAWVRKPDGKTKAALSRADWRWSLIGIDFATGKQVYEQPIFQGKPDESHDNGWAVMTLGPNNTAYIGMWRGALRVASI